MKAFLTNLKEGLKDFPTTVIVTLTGCFLAIYSVVMFWIAIWREWKLEELVLAMLFTFVASVMGVSFIWFGKKRDTYVAPPAGKDREDTPGPSSPSPPQKGGGLNAEVISLTNRQPSKTDDESEEYEVAA